MADSVLEDSADFGRTINPPAAWPAIANADSTPPTVGVGFRPVGDCQNQITPVPDSRLCVVLMSRRGAVFEDRSRKFERVQQFRSGLPAVPFCRFIEPCHNPVPFLIPF
jgi:hypothetical protein